MIPMENSCIGRKRNLGCAAAAQSDLIAIFDDDDFSAPKPARFPSTKPPGEPESGYRVPGLQIH